VNSCGLLPTAWRRAHFCPCSSCPSSGSHRILACVSSGGWYRRRSWCSVADVGRGVHVVDGRRQIRTVCSLSGFPVDQIGFRHHLLQRHAGRQGQRPAVFVLGRIRSVARILSCALSRSVSRPRCCGALAPFVRRERSAAERGSLGEKNLGHFLLILGRRSRDQRAGPVLLHEHRREGHVQSAAFDEPFHGEPSTSALMSSMLASMTDTVVASVAPLASRSSRAGRWRARGSRGRPAP